MVLLFLASMFQPTWSLEAIYVHHSLAVISIWMPANL